MICTPEVAPSKAEVTEEIVEDVTEPETEETVEVEESATEEIVEEPAVEETVEETVEPEVPEVDPWEEKYNAEHGITPQTGVKAVRELIDIAKKDDKKKEIEITILVNSNNANRIAAATE